MSACYFQNDKGPDISAEALDVLMGRSNLRSATYSEPILRLNIPQSKPEYVPSRRTLSHGAEAGLHAGKPLFLVQVSPFLPGANPSQKQRRAGRPRKGTLVSTPRGGSRKGLEYA